MKFKSLCGKKDPINKTSENLAMRGYDPVAYFSEGKFAKGSEAYRHIWNEATWLFVSAEHRDTFMANPEQYAPQYGGYCAYGISRGKFFDGDPEEWSIINDKLYLTLNADILKIWHQDIPNHIDKANLFWPRLIQ